VIKIYGKSFDMKYPSFCESEIDMGAGGISSRFTIIGIVENAVSWYDGRLCLGMVAGVTWPGDFPEPTIDTYGRILIDEDDWTMT